MGDDAGVKTRISVRSLPAVVRPPVAGNGNELQEQLHAGQLVKDLRRLPVQPRWTVLDQELHHLHHLLAAVADRLAEASGGQRGHDITSGKAKPRAKIP